MAEKISDVVTARVEVSFLNSVIVSMLLLLSTGGGYNSAGLLACSEDVRIMVRGPFFSTTSASSTSFNRELDLDTFLEKPLEREVAGLDMVTFVCKWLIGGCFNGCRIKIDIRV